MADQPGKLRWRLGVIVALALACVAMLPQLHLWATRGHDWRGSYVSYDFDEIAYFAYLNTLIDGWPRRNNPYTGLMDHPGSPIPESAHSIQFLPAYALALPARVLGVTPASVFVVLNPLAAFLSALAVFWLLRELIKDDLVAASGTLVILCFGVLAESISHARTMVGLVDIHSTLPFLRRHTPALAFPLFFVFCGLVWRAVSTRTRRSTFLAAALAGITFALLVFSYFFLWTTAAAWLMIVALLWVVVRPGGWRRAFAAFGLIGLAGVAALLPYARMIAHLAPQTEESQLLTSTHALDLARLPELLGLLSLCGLAVGVWLRRLEKREPAMLFAASFSVLPLILFNQQLVTGLSLQPLHYARYTANYTAVTGAFLTLTLIWRAQSGPSRRGNMRLLTILGLALAALVWISVETSVRTLRLARANVDRDEKFMITRKLAALTSDAQSQPTVIFSSDLALTDLLPAVGRRPVLWSPHMAYFSHVTAREDRERLYRQIYYSGVDEPTFASLAGKDSYLSMALFGWERGAAAQTGRPSITAKEIQQEVRDYASYTAAFTDAQAADPRLTYVVIPAMTKLSLANLDHWYERDNGQLVGEFILYRVRLRSSSPH